MKKIIILTMLVALILAFGCISMPSSSGNNTTGGGGSGTRSNPSGSGPTDGAAVTPGGPGSGGGAGTGGGSGTSDGSTRHSGISPTIEASACYTNCEIAGTTRLVAVCKAGCTMDWAKTTRNPAVCEVTRDDPALGDMAANYYYGCLDGVAGAMNSTSPCNEIPTVARRNACVEAAAADAHNPSLCDLMQQDNNDPSVQEQYERAFAQLIRDCKDSAR